MDTRRTRSKSKLTEARPGGYEGRNGVQMKYTYTFDQLRNNDRGLEMRFMNFEYASQHGGVDAENYFTADGGLIDASSPEDACEKLYRAYNSKFTPEGDRPRCYKGRSMSVSDIVNLWDNEQEPPVKTSWFCDSLGFRQI